MSSNVLPTFSLYEALKLEGHELPEECVDVEILMPPQALFQIVYRCNVTPELMLKVTAALKHLAEARLKKER